VHTAAAIVDAVEQEARTPQSGLVMIGLERQACEACMLAVPSSLSAEVP
jgi:hypothetical protein